MVDRQSLLPAALRGLPELPHPGGRVVELRSWCSYHGPQEGASCRACDDAHGINRVALENEARIRALAAELRQLGVDVGPIRSLGEGDPGPNEAKPVMTREEQVAILQAQLKELGA